MRRSFIIVALVALAGWGCQPSPPRTPSPPIAADTALRVRYDRLIQCGYSGRPTLRGFLTTDRAIAVFLRQAYGRYAEGQQFIDVSAGAAAEFFKALPTAEDCDVSVVYLAANQTAEGLWEFVDGTRQPLENWIALTPPHPLRIAIVDACYAGRLCALPMWRQTFTLTVCAADAEQLTYEFRPAVFEPIDLRRRYPAAWQWAQTYLPAGWQERISFLGVMWLDAAARTAVAPVGCADWRALLARCAAGAESYRSRVGCRYHSQVVVCP